ncbi:MAG: hypothetical protein AAB658_10245, partial [Chloroflexota bacterium]
MLRKTPGVWAGNKRCAEFDGGVLNREIPRISKLSLPTGFAPPESVSSSSIIKLQKGTRLGRVDSNHGQRIQ